MLYKVTTFSPFGEPTTVEVNAKSMKAATVRQYCLVEDGKGKYRRYYLRKPVGSFVKTDKIWRNGKLVYLLTVDKKWQEVHPTDKYHKKQNEVKPEPKLKKKFTTKIGDYPMVTPNLKAIHRANKKFNESLENLITNNNPWVDPHALKKEVNWKPKKYNAARSFYKSAKFVESLMQPKIITASLDETNDTPNSTGAKISNESVTLATCRDTETRGHIAKISGLDNAKHTDGSICLNGSTLSLSGTNRGMTLSRRKNEN